LLLGKHKKPITGSFESLASMWSPSKKQKLNLEEEKQCPECNGEEISQCLTCSKRTPNEEKMEVNNYMAHEENAEII